MERQSHRRALWVLLAHGGRFIEVHNRSVVFSSAAFEHVPAGYRARETYRIVDANTFIERFEIA